MHHWKIIRSPQSWPLQGPFGSRGAVLPELQTRVLTYCGVSFTVSLSRDILRMIDDVDEVNGDDLLFIKTVDLLAWEKIRSCWSNAYLLDLAGKSFDEGMHK